MRRHNKRIVDGITDELEGYAKSVTVLIDAGAYDKLVRPYNKDAAKLEFEDVEFKLIRTKDTRDLDGIPSGFVLTLIELEAKAADFRRRTEPIMENKNGN